MEDDIDTPSSNIPQESNVEESPSQFVSRIRGQSCYSVLRSVINVTAFLLIAGLGGFLVHYNLSFSEKFSHGSNVSLGMMMPLIVSVIGIVLVVAFRQLALLLIDIADTLIEQTRWKSE